MLPVHLASPFSPDLFSQSQPVFSPLDDAQSGLLRSLIEEHYQDPISTPTQLWKSGAIEINSNNFKVKTKKGVFIFKRFSEQDNENDIATSLALLSWLGKQGAPVARIISAKNGPAVCRFQDRFWAAFEFVEGQFFSGDPAELSSTGKEIGRLHGELKKTPKDFLPSKVWTYGDSSSAALFKEIKQNQAAWEEKFGADLASLLKENWPTLEENFGVFQTPFPFLQRFPSSVSHGDLHPHNMLMRNGRFSRFLDFQSFVQVSPVVAIGFCVFKLIRQTAAFQGWTEKNKKEIERQAGMFRKEIGEALQADLIKEELEQGARLEVFRRLFAILKLNWVDQNPQWNSVAGIQISGLKEIPVIFSGE